MLEELIRRCITMIDVLCDYIDMGGEQIEDGDYVWSKAKEAKDILSSLVESKKK